MVLAKTVFGSTSVSRYCDEISIDPQFIRGLKDSRYPKAVLSEGWYCIIRKVSNSPIIVLRASLEVVVQRLDEPL